MDMFLTSPLTFASIIVHYDDTVFFLIAAVVVIKLFSHSSPLKCGVVNSCDLSCKE